MVKNIWIVNEYISKLFPFQNMGSLQFILFSFFIFFKNTKTDIVTLGTAYYFRSKFRREETEKTHIWQYVFCLDWGFRINTKNAWCVFRNYLFLGDLVLKWKRLSSQLFLMKINLRQCSRRHWLLVISGSKQITWHVIFSPNSFILSFQMLLWKLL